MQEEKKAILELLSSSFHSQDLSPLIGFESIPWEDITHTMEQSWELPSFSLEAKEIQSLKGGNLLAGFSEDFYVVAFHFTPLVGEVFWVMDRLDLAKLCAEFLIRDKQKKEISSEALQEGFYHFLLTQMLDMVSQHAFFKNFSPKIVSQVHLPEASCLGIDIQIKLKKKNFWGRLLFSPEFQKTWNPYLSEHFPEQSLSPSLSKQEVLLSLCIEEVSLPWEEWKQARVGDFLLLENASYDPTLHIGRGTLFFKNYPLFQVEIGNKQLQVMHTSLRESKSDLLQLQIKVGQLHLPISTLLQVKKGSSFQLEKTMGKAVMEAEGEKQGEGDLIFLGNQLGLRITQLA